MFIFLRVHFKDSFIWDGPTGCIGTAHPSGWMTEDGFVHFIKHFVNQVCLDVSKIVSLCNVCRFSGQTFSVPYIKKIYLTLLFFMSYSDLAPQFYCT